jgi:hypothetical protein
VLTARGRYAPHRQSACLCCGLPSRDNYWSLGGQSIKTWSQQRIDTRPWRSLYVMAAVAIALATILNVISVQAQVGKSSSTGDTKPPVVHVAPKKIDFRKFHAGMTSPPRGVVFTNKSNADLAAPAVAVSGTGFSLFFNGCATTLSAGGSCTVSVTFKPPSKGEFHGSLTFNDGGAKSPQKVKLDGIGLAAVATATPTATATLSPTPTPTVSTTPPRAPPRRRP